MTNLEAMIKRKQLIREAGEDTAETDRILAQVEAQGGLSYEDMLALMAS